MKVIKRYANRKLYDTEKSSYVTLEEIAEMVRAGEDIRIVDQKTDEDLTSVTLAQIVFEEEKRSKRILPLPALRSIIQSGGEFLQRLSQPVHQLREDTQRQMERMLRPPAEAIDEGRQAIREYSAGIQRAVDEFQKRMDERVKDAVGGLTHLPELEAQVTDLSTRLAQIEERLERLDRMVERLLEEDEATGKRRAGPR